MHAHPLPHIHLWHPHIDLRHLGRDALIATELGLSATVVTAGERTTMRGSEAAVVQEAATTADVSLSVEVHVDTLGALAIIGGVDSSAVTAVSLVDEHGDQVPLLTTESGLRFEDVPAGSYRIVVSSEGPIVRVDGSVISSAVVVRSEPFVLLATGLVFVESR
jgi:hypothetical protein